MNFEQLTILILLVAGACIVLCCLANREKVNEEDTEEKVNEDELVQSYLDWWLNSKFNKFEVVKKYTAMLSKEDRYRAVIRQVCTDTYEDKSLSVTEWYRWDEGTILNYSKAPKEYCLQKDSIEEFNKATGSKLTYALVRRYFYFYD